MSEEKKNESTGRIIQRVFGVTITLGLFIYLTVNGHEVPDGIEILLVAGVGTLIVGVEDLKQFWPYGKK